MTSSESQSQRWFKYGANVALSSVVVIALAAGVTYVAQRNAKRIDTTLAGVYSLKPQTKSVIQSVPGKVRIVSLYSNPETSGKSGTALKEAEEQRRYASTVSDLLQEYAKASDKVSLEFIDPGRESDKVDVLVKEVVGKYGAELKPYEDFFKNYQPFVEKFKTFATAQSDAIAKVPTEGITDQDLAQSFTLAAVTVSGLPERLEAAQKKIDPFLKRKPVPDYRGASDELVAELQLLNTLMSPVITGFKSLPATTPAPVKAYVEKALPEFESAQKLVEGQLEQARGLKDLKLDSLREAIQRNTVVVMGDKEMRVLGFKDVWKAPDDLRAFINNEGNDKPPLKFAGEQQVSTALLAISQPKKPLAIIVRAGGPPLTQSLMRRADYRVLAGRLADANFDIVEKDLSGQFAMAAAQQGFPIKEADDAQMHDRSAIWIVMSITPANMGGGPMGQMGSPMPGKVLEHLTEGGSALVMINPECDNLDAALSAYGVTVRSDAVLLKKPPGAMAAAGSSDIIEQAARLPHLLVTSRFGVSPITEPVNGLQGLLYAMVPVMYQPGPDRTGTPLLPWPTSIPTWGETDLNSIGGATPPTYDAGKDIEGGPDHPLFAGVAVEKKAGGGGRLVVLGSTQIANDQILSIPDPELAKGDNAVFVPRFPANAELVMNSIFWLGKMDTMLAISPAAMEVSRVRDIPEGQLRFIRWGVLTIGLPGLVMIAGIAVYLTRRD